jgi:hypothetical protein
VRRHPAVARAACALLVIAASAGACDPVHDDAKAALGGEAPGVRPGPLHRAGQPCLVCHDGAAGDPPAFSVAGTVFLDANDTTPVAGAAVILGGADGVTSPASTTNAAGNFYLTPDEYAPRYPFSVNSITVGDVAIAMHSHIGGNGSCAGCHVDPPGPDSPGHVYFNVPPGMTP